MPLDIDSGHVVKAINKNAGKNKSAQKPESELLFMPHSALRRSNIATAESPVQVGGNRLRMARQKLGLSLRDVEVASIRIARKHNSQQYVIPISRLSDFENKGVLPSVHRFYTLAVILRVNLRELLCWYGVDPHSEFRVYERTSQPQAPSGVKTLSFDAPQTRKLKCIIQQWGTGPLAYLEQFSRLKLTYGYIGTEDFTMYPILPPGSFVQVDESRNKVKKTGWHTEYDWPIYFVETRDAYVCCWCTLQSDSIVLQPHPLSPVSTRIVSLSEAEVIGQVVGVAMRLGS
jgi:transcriptional regulator with XRE-family HTH domain